MPQNVFHSFKDKKAARRLTNQYIPVLVVVITGIDVTMGTDADTDDVETVVEDTLVVDESSLLNINGVALTGGMIDASVIFVVELLALVTGVVKDVVTLVELSAVLIVIDVVLIRVTAVVELTPAGSIVAVVESSKANNIECLKSVGERSLR